MGLVIATCSSLGLTPLCMITCGCLLNFFFLTAIEKGKACRSRVLCSRICILGPLQTVLWPLIPTPFSPHQFSNQFSDSPYKSQCSPAFVHASLWPTRTATSLHTAKYCPNTAYLQSVYGIDNGMSLQETVSQPSAWLSTPVAPST
jgi:hypothetical protein